MTTRTYTRRTVAARASLGTVAALSGCLFPGPVGSDTVAVDLDVSNYGPQPQTVAITVTDESDTVLIEREVTVDAGDTVTVDSITPEEDGEAETYMLTAELDQITESLRFQVGGSSGTNLVRVEIRGDDLRITRIRE